VTSSSNPLSRRALLRDGLALAGVGLLVACSRQGSPAPPAPVLMMPDGPQVNAVDARRYRDGLTRTFSYTATPDTVDLGGPTVSTWSYDGVVPGRELRVTAGDQVQVNVTNQLPQDTTMHWHGLAIRNNMDGVPYVTQNPIRAADRSATAMSSTSRAPTGTTPMSGSSSTAVCTDP
jgi:FtsP/CotA-like multicopper oxidase with cupredoxin domain